MSAQPTAALTAATDTGFEGEVNREFLRYLVGKRLTCAETGSLLDIRQAVAVEVTDDATGRCAALQITTAAAYDGTGAARAAEWAAVGGYTVTVYDGRRLHGADQ